jgi:hypothetical protein
MGIVCKTAMNSNGIILHRVMAGCAEGDETRFATNHARNLPGRFFTQLLSMHHRVSVILGSVTNRPELMPSRPPGAFSMPQNPGNAGCSSPRGVAVSSIHLIAMAYDLAVLACERRDAESSVKTITLLRDVMRFAGQEDVSDLLELYDWCVGRIREGEYALAAQALTSIRDSWKDTEDRLLSTPQ